MLWVKATHRAPDEGSGFGGRRVCLQLHKSLDDPTEPKALDAQAVAHNFFPSRNSSPSEAAAFMPQTCPKEA
jgi:hypothetical protein